MGCPVAEAWPLGHVRQDAVMASEVALKVLWKSPQGRARLDEDRLTSGRRSSLVLEIGFIERGSGTLPKKAQVRRFNPLTPGKGVQLRGIVMPRLRIIQDMYFVKLFLSLPRFYCQPGYFWVG
jgi:hypothetical protein